MSYKPHIQTRSRPRLTILVWIGLLSVLLAACGTAQAKTYTIGVANHNPILNDVFEGFKAEMTTLGYVEGTNVTYIYHGVIAPDPQVIDREIESLLDQKVNLLFTMATAPTLAAKIAVEGTNIPVVFTPLVNPVGEGIVTSLSHPGGNVTGVQTINGAPKALEWLLKFAPGTKTVYVFYSPKDRTAVTVIKPLPEAASRLKIELVLDAVDSPEEMLAHIKTLPKGAAILSIPSPTIESGTSAMKKLAIERGIPVGRTSEGTEDLLFTYATDRVAQGRKAARLADQILKGTKPADLPVETGDFFLSINLKTAKAIGLDISDEILRQAEKVVR